MKLLLRVIAILCITTVSAFANEKISLQLLWKHQFEFAGFYMAKEKGFYEEAGVEVEIKEFDFGVDIVDDVLSGTTDIGIGRSSLVLDRLNGKDVVLLSAIYQSSPYVLVSKQRPDLINVEDFKDKKIMLSDDLGHLASISSMMKMKDIKPSDYIEVPHSFNIEDLVDGQVDLMTIYLSNEPFHLIESGVGYRVFDPKDYGFDFYADLVFTSQNYLDANEENIEKFHEATLKGWEYAFENIDETVDIILKKYNSQNKSKKALFYEAGILKKLAYKDGVEFGNISEARIQEIAYIYRLLGMTNKSDEALSGLLYEPHKFSEMLKRLFSLEVFLIVLGIILINYLLTLYEQHILKRENKNLGEIIEAKTIKLKQLNEGLEEKIKERTKELENALSVKSNFLANMSHEIRTPLNGIVGFVDILHKNETDDKKRLKLQIVKESSHSLLTIINDILDFSKMESKKMLIEKEPINVREIFWHVSELFFDKAKEKDINITLDIDENLPKDTLGDATRIKQVFSNILSNAIKFANNSSTIVVNVNCMCDENRLYCEVIDNGIGIEANNIDSIFNSFEQADSSVSRNYGGTGLGLSISKNLVELMGGTIGVESELGVGSKFYFSIKMHEVES
ncbi:ABC transporter substrate-binding protein [Sulfurimonas sp.]|uniref:ABC transporter substrate-binding protein n=1 Tax=Sulfurimonas sp. TaxID=2022749 RepID=UPI003563E9D2